MDPPTSDAGLLEARRDELIKALAELRRQATPTDEGSLELERERQAVQRELDEVHELSDRLTAEVKGLEAKLAKTRKTIEQLRKEVHV